MLISKRAVLGLVVCVGLSVSMPSFSQEHGSKDEALALVDAALVHIKKVGAEKAFDDFTNDKSAWTKKDLYVFVNDLEGVARANGGNAKLIGKSLIALKDQNGKEFAKEMQTVATTKGEGWVDYDWFSPAAKKVENKSSFVKRIPGFSGYVAVGIYR